MGSFADKLARESPAFQRAYLGSLAPNLVKSENLEKYYQTLTDFEFIQAKINYPEFSVQALIEDYGLMDKLMELDNSEYHSKNIKTLKLIQKVLQLSAHVVAVDKTQLISQLQGRLLGKKITEIQALLTQAQQQTTIPWLRPVTASLTIPGSGLIRTITGHNSYVKAVAITPNGEQVISASSDKILKLWNLKSGEEKFTLSGHSGSVNAVAITHDSKYIVSASDDETLKVWHLQTGQEAYTFFGHSDSVNAVAITPDGKYVIFGSLRTLLTVWNSQTSEEVHIHWFPSRGAVAVNSPYNKWVFYNPLDKTLNVCYMKNGEEMGILHGHSSLVNTVVFTPNGKYVISGSDDTTLKIWNWQTRELMTTFTGESGIRCCAVAPDGMRIVAGEASGRVHFLRLEGIKGG